MKKSSEIFLLISFFITANIISVFDLDTEIPCIECSIVIVTASYNNAKWYQKNLDSVFAQKYKNFHLIYIDDNSTDGTYELVKAYIKEKGMLDRVTLVHNKRRRNALANQYNAIHSCKNTDIIINLDGDDWLYNDDVLAYINRVYADPRIWLTYGQFQYWPSGGKGYCLPMPDRIIKQNAFRDFTHNPSHLRTFNAGLFKKIKKEDLMYQGDFLKMTGDNATMLPMIEMARDHFKFIPDILMVWNSDNQINDHKISGKLQYSLDQVIRSRQRYEKINNPF